MSVQIIEPEPIEEIVMCGVCIKKTAEVEDEEYCPVPANDMIELPMPDETIHLPVCKEHGDKLEEGKELIIKERNGERKFMIQWG